VSAVRSQFAVSSPLGMPAYYSTFNLAVLVCREHNDDCKRLLQLLGCPIVEVSADNQLTLYPFWRHSS
jgi:hypothetical protein